ncbi:MAG: hypothetical protein KKB59_20215 [Spirochaetes bacterium]|nr:hypothetical protein [Spirochaetota bacterium]
MKKKQVIFSSTPQKLVPIEFDAEFQLALIQVLYKRPTFCGKIGLYLDPDKHFDLPMAKWLASSILDYYNAYRVKPTKRSLKSMLLADLSRHVLNDATAFAIRDFIKKELGKIPKDEGFIMDQAQNYVTFQIQMEAAGNVLIAAEKGDIEGAQAAFAKGAAVSVNFGASSTSYVKDTDRALEERKGAVKNAVPSGLPIDEWLQHNGPERQHVCVIMAATGVGKTATGVHIGGACVRNGFKVAHAIIEATRPELRLRYDANFAELSQDDVEKYPKRIKGVARKLGQRFGDPLRYERFSPGELTPIRLRAWINQLRAENFAPDVLIIDSPDDMIPDGGTTGDEYRDAGSIYVGLIKIAEDYDLVCWTTTQGNREALEAKTLKLSMVSDSLRKVIKASLVIAVCQTFKESLSHPAKARLTLLKNRWGRKNMEVSVYLDWAKQRILTASQL